MKRYHPYFVALHWLMALMIIALLVVGNSILAETPNSDPEKIDLLRIHMSVGTLILVLMVIRLAVRLFKPRPAPAESGNPVLNRLGTSVHYLFYLAVIAMGASGTGIAILAGLPEIVFGGSGAPLPADFLKFPPRIAHGYLATFLMALIVLHFAGFVFHQFIRKDNLFNRMWFGGK